MVREGIAWVWQDGNSLVREFYTLTLGESGGSDGTAGYHRIVEARDENEKLSMYGYMGDKLASVTLPMGWRIGIAELLQWPFSKRI